jgi:hypothetical protein
MSPCTVGLYARSTRLVSDLGSIFSETAWFW